MMEAIADSAQNQEGIGGIEEEGALEAFENYVEARRKMLEKKRARGFTAVEGPKWRLSGSMTGKLEQIKARTQCHLRKRQVETRTLENANAPWQPQRKGGGKRQGRSRASSLRASSRPKDLGGGHERRLHRGQDGDAGADEEVQRQANPVRRA